MRGLTMPHALRRRLMITLAALTVCMLMARVPIPGVLIYASIEQQALARFSVMALGLYPWLSAVALAELAALFLPARWTASFTRGGHADPFARMVVAGALVIAALQAYGVAIALEANAGIPLGGEAFRFGAIASMTAATALLVLLAAVITHRGVGHGFWVFLAATALWNISTEVRVLALLWTNGSIGSTTVFFTGGVFAVSLAAIAALVLARWRASFADHQSLACPLYLYPVVLPWVIFAVDVSIEALGWNWASTRALLPDQPLGAGLAVVLIAGLSLRYGRRSGTRGLAVIEAALLSCLLLATATSIHWLDVPLPAASALVVLTFVTTNVTHEFFATSTDPTTTASGTTA
jgi:SecY